MKTAVAILAIALATGSLHAQRKHEAKISKEQATKTALEQVKGGTIQSSELEKEEGKLIWSFDIKSGDAIKEVWIDALTGAAIKTETESTVNETNEKTTEKAEKAALKRVPGEIVKKNVEKEKGKTIYSFDIKTISGKVVEVEIDAKTNKVVKIETADNEEKENK